MRCSHQWKVSMLAPVLLVLSSCTPPSNSHLASIARRYAAAKEEYATLHKRFVEDGLTQFTTPTSISSRAKVNGYYRVSQKWYDPEYKPTSFSEVLRVTGISEDRFRFYADTLRKLGIETVRKDGNDIYFYVEGFGILDGYFVQIVSTPDTPPGKIVATVDAIPTDIEGDYCVRLDDNWYLWYSLSY